MDESKRVPPKPLNDSEKPAEPTPSFAPSKEALAMIERAALAMADRKRVKRPDQLANTDNIPARTMSPAEPPEPFMVTRSPEPSATGKPSQAKLIAELDALLGNVPAKPAATVEGKTGAMIGPDIAARTEIQSETVRATESKPDSALKAGPRITPQNAAAALRPLFDDQFRLKLTRPQSAAIALAVMAFVVGACGLAAQTWVSAHDWGCRTAMTTKFCPPPASVPEPPAPPEIPV